MSKLFGIAATLSVAIGLPTAVGAAPVRKPVPAKKPAAARPGGPIVLGTNQLPGDFGKIGQTYTIGQREPINFTLKSAEYTVVPFTVDNNTWVPKADEKLLVLHYTVHNPIPREQYYDWPSIRFTAVDAKDQNHTDIQAVAREATHDKVSLSLKPAQKLDVMTAIVVPAEGVVPKLMVQHEQGTPVIRYDLRGKVSALPQNAADAADATGATARREVPLAAGEWAALGVFDARLDSLGESAGPLVSHTAAKGSRFITATFTIRNRTASKQTYVWSDFIATMRDTDGEKSPFTQALLKASRDEVAYGELEPGEEARVRFFFLAPEGVKAKTVNLLEGKRVHQTTARTFAFDATKL